MNDVCNENSERLIRVNKFVDEAFESGSKKLLEEALLLCNHILTDTDTVKDDSAELHELYFLTLLNKSTILKRIGRYQEAIEPLELICSYYPNDIDSIITIGMLLEALNRPQEAFKKYEKAIDVYQIRLAEIPEDVIEHVKGASLYLYLEEKEKALAELRKVALKFPEYSGLMEHERDQFMTFDKELRLKEFLKI